MVTPLNAFKNICLYKLLEKVFMRWQDRKFPAEVKGNKANS